MMEKKDCIFCKIIAQEIPSTIVHQTNNLLVIKDIHPKAPIHYLIIPKKHIENVSFLSSEDKELAGELLLAAQELGAQVKKDFKLIVNNGPAAGQIVFHLHIHFLAGRQFGEL